MKLPILVGALVLAANAVHAECKIQKLAELPVTMSDLRPTIHAKIEGHDIRLMADSGAFFSTLSQGAAAELKLPTRPAPFGFSVVGIGGEATTSLTTVKSFFLDTIPLPNAGFIVAGSEEGPGVAGLLGRNILNIADAEYDLANGVIRLMRPEGCGGKALAYWAGQSGYSVVGVNLIENERFPETQIFVSVNGVDFRALLDTGSGTTVISKSAAARAGMAVSGSTVTSPSESGGVGRRYVRTFVSRVNSIKIGDEDIQHTRLRVLDSLLEGSDMLLGADFFLSHRVFVSNSQHKVYFTYNGGPVFNLAAQPVVATIDAKAAPPGASAGDPTDAAGLARRGAAYASRGDFPHAVADLGRAIALSPKDADYLVQLAQVHIEARQGLPAMFDLGNALELRPDDAQARVLRATLRLQGNDASGAIRDLDAVAARAAPGADIRFELAELYWRADKPQQAVAQYDLWIPAHAEDNRRGAAFKGRCWSRALANQDLPRALADCQIAHRLRPKDTDILDSRAFVFLRMAQFDKALADYDLVIAADPKANWSLFCRGVVKSKMGDIAGGKADIAAAVAVDATVSETAAKRGVSA